MDALSAMKMMTASAAGSPLEIAGQGGAAQSIPLQDLQKLNTDLAPQTVGGAASSSSTGGTFQNVLGNFVNEVNGQQAAASDAMSGLMSGKNVSLHQAMISMEEASVSFQMMVEVRNKLLDSYQELMRMQI